MKNRIRKILLKYSNPVILTFIMMAGFFVRMRHLDRQSLWFDELHTAATCGPDIDLDRFWFIYSHDSHPPFFYFTEWIWLHLVGLGDARIRFPSVIYGVLGIYAVYLLGTKLKNPKLGLIAAAILTFNTFHIHYSQEAREYGLLFALSAFSFSFLFDILQNKKYKIPNLLSYTLTTTLILYTHYFGLFILATQVLLIFIFLLIKHKSIGVFIQKNEYQAALISTFVSALVFLPMIPSVLRLSSFKSNDGVEGPQMLIDYIYIFFGENPFLILIFLIGLFLALTKDGPKSLGSPAVVFLIVWGSLTLLLPYAKSYILTPNMHVRYFSATYPVLIVFLALAVYSIKYSSLQMITVAGVMCLSLLNLCYEKNHYETTTKADWRSMGRFLASHNSRNHPLLDITPANNPLETDYKGIYCYYPNFYGPKVVMTNEVDFLNSGKKGIWIFESIWMPEPKDFIQRLQKNGFTLTRHSTFYESKVMLWEKEL